MGTVRIEQWRADDIWLIEAMNAPELMTELGGPETPEKVVERQNRYFLGWERGTSWMFRIVLSETGEAVGGIGYWPTEWNDELVYETGWTVLAAHHGRGIATKALELVVDHAATFGDRRWLHALPKVSNGASNAVCRKAGFELRGEIDDEYPPGNPIVSNDWFYDLGERQPK
jgi:RimJ/RimL family protein N-acetyltransferase